MTFLSFKKVTPFVLAFFLFACLFFDCKSIDIVDLHCRLFSASRFHNFVSRDTCVSFVTENDEVAEPFSYRASLVPCAYASTSAAAVLETVLSVVADAAAATGAVP